ncbi:MAG: hypothetical protein V3U84_04115 [Thiotrichaceae bacterium]
MTNINQDQHSEKIDGAIKMLNLYIKDDSIVPLLTLLEALKSEPENETLISQLSDTLNGLGTTQGAVLTYAPYVSILLSDDPFGDMPT